MRFHAIRSMVLGLGAAAVLAVTWPVHAQEAAAVQPAESHNVAKTYNNAPFTYQSRLLSDRSQFRVYRLTYPSPVVTAVPQNNTVPADYYVPKNLQAGAKYPAVICLHILNGDEQLTDLVCSVLAGRGVPAISFKMPYYGERALPKGPDAMADDPKMFVGAIAQVGEDIRRTIDLLASRDEINPERIGITGISLGGITGATAAGAEPRIYRAALMLAGGDLLPIIRHAGETRKLTEMIDSLSPQDKTAVETKIGEVDPLRFAPALRDRAQAGRVMMINAGDDEVIPRQYTEKLAKAIGIEDKVVWFDGLGQAGRNACGHIDRDAAARFARQSDCDDALGRARCGPVPSCRPRFHGQAGQRPNHRVARPLRPRCEGAFLAAVRSAGHRPGCTRTK
jgi:dienelactone hydrolase